MSAPELTTNEAERSRASSPADNKRRIRPLWLGLIALTVLTTLMTTTQSQSTLYIFNACLLACMGAIALNLLMGTAGQVSIGNAAFLAIGAYGVVALGEFGVPFPVNVLLAALIAGIVGAVFALPALRLKGLHLALSTLAVHFIVMFAAREYQSAEAGVGGFIVEPLFSSYSLDVAQIYWAWLLFACVAGLIVAVHNMTSNRLGRAWRMIRDHERAAGSLGIPVIRYKMYAFVISSVIIAAQGGLAAYMSGSIGIESFSLYVAITYIAMVLIGGLDSILGSVIGAFIITALPTVVPNILSGILGEQRVLDDGPFISQILYGGLIVIFIVSSAGGVVGWLREMRRHILVYGGRVFRKHPS